MTTPVRVRLYIEADIDPMKLGRPSPTAPPPGPDETAQATIQAIMAWLRRVPPCVEARGVALPNLWLEQPKILVPQFGGVVPIPKKGA